MSSIFSYETIWNFQFFQCHVPLTTSIWKPQQCSFVALSWIPKTHGLQGPPTHLCNGNLVLAPWSTSLSHRVQRWSGLTRSVLNDSRRQFFAKSMGVTGVFPWLSASVLQVICSSSRRDSRRRSPLRTVMNEAPGTDWRFEVDQTETSKVTKT